MISSRIRPLIALGALFAASMAVAQPTTTTTIPALTPPATTTPVTVPATGPDTSGTTTGGAPALQTLPAPAVGATATTPSGLEVGSLGDVTPDYGGTLQEGGGGFPVDMWKGTDRALVERLLPKLSPAASSPAMRDLTRRLMLTNAEAPAGKSGGVNLFGARADRLMAMGLSSDAAALLALQPARSTDPVSARQRIDSLLLAGDVDGACKAVDETRKVASGDVAWQKAQIFCQLRAAQNDQAALGLDLLREQGENDPAFFTLVDVLSGNKAAKLDSLPAPTALDLAMLHAANMPIPRDAAQVQDPAVLAAIARDPAIDVALRLAAAEQAAAAGGLPIDQLQIAYASVPYSPGDLGNAIEVSSHDPGPGSRAMLFQAAGVVVQTGPRAHVLSAALDRARRQGGYLLAVESNLQFLLTIVPTDDLTWFAADAGRALYAAGHYEQANAWLALSQKRAASDPQAAAAVSSLAVYARIAGVGPPLAWDGAAVAKWRQAQAANNPAGDPAARLFAIFEGLGEPIGGSWSMIGQSGATGGAAGAGAPDPALWFNLGDAAGNRRIGETVLLALYALGADGPGAVNPIMLSRAIGSLRQIGLDAEARAIAIEAAIAAGV
jgi:hypothetical protein